MSWQAQALAELPDDAECLILNCTNTRLKRRPLRHAFYYLLNLTSLRSRLTRQVPIPRDLRVSGRVDFEAEWEGAWQKLPGEILNLLLEWRPHVGVKFGMGLLRVPAELKCRILSYHHGDPRTFRGRPAGFYELLGSVPVIGQIVQVISNRLDGGAVVAFAETPSRSHSYRSTMAAAYSVSPLLLKEAIRNCLAGKVLPIPPEGRNYRLPSNWLVARFCAMLLRNKLRRLWRGAFFYKEWHVATAKLASEEAEALLVGIRDPARWQAIRRPRPYRFIADPFFHPAGGVVVEALRNSDGQGEIVRIAESGHGILCTGPGHFSYPSMVESAGEWFILPEISEWTTPRLYRLHSNYAEFATELKIDGCPRLVDPTLFAAEDGMYLFGSIPDETPSVLRLWRADALHSEFKEHPLSPIRISPVGSRMGGAILDLKGGLYRIGQNGSRGYGNGIILFKINALSADAYEEKWVTELTFDRCLGPHTLNRRDDLLVFDFYRERFELSAGLMRARAVLARWLAARKGVSVE